jgi:ABC-type bacteriocin/lantibiotic exporter with double-glycine peptidase domain
MDANVTSPVVVPQTLTLQPGQLLALDNPNEAGRIEAGRIEIYCVTDGRRHFLGQLGAGETIFGGTDTAGQLIALAPDGATVRLMTAEEGWRAVQDPLAVWVQRLSEGAARHAPTRPEVLVAMAGETAAVAPGKAISASHGVVWISADGQPPALFMGESVIVGGPFAVSPVTWISFTEGVQASFADTASLLATLDPATPLRQFHSALIDAVKSWHVARSAAGLERIERLEDLTRESLLAAGSRMRAVLTGEEAETEEERDDISFVLSLALRRKVGATPRLTPDAPPPPFLEAAELQGLLSRQVSLPDEWWKSDQGPLIAVREEDGRLAALVPDWRGRYWVHIRDVPPTRMVASRSAEFSRDAFLASEALPNRPTVARELIGICIAAARADFATLAAATLAVSLLGLVTPLATAQVVDVFIPDRLNGPLLTLGCALVVMSVCGALLRLCTNLARSRLDARISIAIQSGVMDRILRMPSTVLRSTASVDLAMQAMSVDQVRRTVLRVALGTGLSGVFGLSGFAVLLFYSPLAGALAFALFGVLIALAMFTGARQQKELASGEAMSTDVMTFALQLIQNVATLRVFGAERRAFAVWASDAARMRSRGLRSRVPYLVFDAFVNSYDTVALAAVFGVLGATGGASLSVGAALAFVVTYQGFLIASEGLARAVVQIAGLHPTMIRVKRVLSTAPDNPPTRKYPGVISGAVELSNVVFSYGPNMPPVLRGVSLRVEAGQSVAIVGPSGCGKSTLMNMLLGVDAPAGGMVLYDGHDLMQLDRRLLRRQIGVVRQGGRLLAGSIFENIMGLHQGSLQDAWLAAETAAIADDIRAMPMGMHTVLNEGTAAMSGGQVQRLLIARALAGRPRMVVLDEATSALDNVTQSIVSRNIDRLGITRVIVAHRLSTVMQSDMIHFLDHGRVAESGNAQSLIAAGGRFASFIQRQSL